MEPYYDIIIAGAGLAGLSAALELDNGFSVLLLSKQELTRSNSYLAQGGIAAALDTENDSPELHYMDTFSAGGFAGDEKSLSVMVNSAYGAIETLLGAGVEFDRNPDGSFSLAIEGGHSRRRVLHSRDTTGKTIIRALTSKAKSLANIHAAEHTVVADVKKHDGYFFLNILNNRTTDNKNGSLPVVCCRYLLLATGGIGQLYRRTTNSRVATGDGIVFAKRLGAEIKNISYIQFHPTAYKSDGNAECFLISEAVRGEGAYLTGPDGGRFMERYDKRMELAPRDVVSRAILEEQKRTQKSDFFLDITHKSADFIQDRFPVIYEYLLSCGVDMTKEPVPVYPCQHYLMGGIDTDVDGRTTVDGLYAAGECAHTGVHSNNRLASNSLLEAAVFGTRVAAHINSRGVPAQKSLPQAPEFANGDQKLPAGLRQTLREIMQRSYFIEPDREYIAENIQKIRKISEIPKSGSFAVTQDFTETMAITEVALMILEDVMKQGD